MKKILLTSLIAGLCTLSLLILVASKAVGQPENIKLIKSNRKLQKIPNRYIVVLEDWAVDTFSSTSVGVETTASQLSTAYSGDSRKIKNIYKHALKGYAAEMSASEAKALRRDPRVKLVEQDSYVYASATQTGATWGLDRIDQRDLPLNGNYNYTLTGNGVNAYIIDTGILTTHSQFGGRASVAYNGIKDGRNGQDCNGHGTHVAGTIGGSTYGVAKNVTLHSVRVLDCSGSGTTSEVIAGVDWVKKPC